MASKLFILLYFAVAALGSPMPSNPLVDRLRAANKKYYDDIASYPRMSDMTKCQLARSQSDLYHNTPTETLGGFIGMGYDDLYDSTRLAVFEETYKDCKMTPDNSYFLPDGYTIKVIRKANLDRATSKFESKKSDSFGMEMGVGVDVTTEKMSASFSMDISASSKSAEEKGKTTLNMKSTNLMYVMKGNKAAKLSGEFESRIRDVLIALRNKNPRRVKRLIEETYRDFGTNVILEATLGSELTVKTIVDKAILETETKFSLDIKMEIDVDAEYATVKGGLKVSGNMSTYDNSSNVDEKKEIYARGGPTLIKLASNNSNEFMSVDHVVALNRNYRPIYEIMHGGALVSFNMTTSEIQIMRMHFEAVYKEYIERNTYYGCLDREKANFDNQANVDDNTCDGDYCSLVNIEVKCQIHEVVKQIGLINKTKDEDEDERECYKFVDSNKKSYEDAKKNAKKTKDNTGAEKAKKTYTDSLAKCRKEHKHFEYQTVLNYTEVDVNDEFFRKADQKEYLECTRKGHFVRDEQNNFKNKVCGRVNGSWKQRKTKNGGMFQRCSVGSESVRTIEELEKLNIIEPSPCTGLKIENIYTKDFTCPAGTKKIEIISYNILLNDRVHSYWKHECDDEALGCVEVNIDFFIRHSVDISSYWCGENQKTSVFYAGVFDRGQINSYYGNSGCPIGMTAYPFFHDTTFCISERVPFSSDYVKDTNNDGLSRNENTAELTRLFKGTDDPNYCKEKHTKQLITVITHKRGIDRIYACIFKKAAYYHLPPPSAVKMPFRVIGLTIDEYSESTATIYYHDRRENVFLKSFGANLVGFVDNVTKTLMAELMVKRTGNGTKELETLKMETEEETAGFFSVSTVIIIVIVIALLFLLLCLCTRG